VVILPAPFPSDVLIEVGVGVFCQSFDMPGKEEGLGVLASYRGPVSRNVTMKRKLFVFDSELSDRAFALLVGHGVRPRFERRGLAGDVVSVPARLYRASLRALIALQG
jgi:hypothetical protein